MHFGCPKLTRTYALSPSHYHAHPNITDTCHTSGPCIEARTLQSCARQRWVTFMSHHYLPCPDMLSIELHAPGLSSWHSTSLSVLPHPTQVRKLLPESWGFFCPVHTPDGSPCGLLNHFTAACRIVTHGPDGPSEADNAIMQVCVRDMWCMTA